MRVNLKSLGISAEEFASEAKEITQQIISIEEIINHLLDLSQMDGVIHQLRLQVEELQEIKDSFEGMNKGLINIIQRYANCENRIVDGSDILMENNGIATQWDDISPPENWDELKSTIEFKY